MTSPGRLVALYAVLVAILATILYGDLGAHDWAFDDEDYIANAQIAHSRFAHILDPQKSFAARPVVHLYFWVVSPLFGENPGPYHLANVAIHAINALLVAMLCRAAVSSRMVAGTAGLLFLVHLSHFRAFYWVSGISHLLACGFGIGCVLLCFRYLEDGRRTKLLSSYLALAAAALSHEAAAVLVVPLGLLLLQSRTRIHALAFSGFVAIAVGIWLVSQYYFPTPLSTASEFGGGVHVLPNICRFLFRILAGTVTDAWTITWPPHVQVGLGVLIGVGIGVWAFGVAQSSSRHRALLAWLLATIGIFSIWPQGPSNWRYYYLPTAVACILLAQSIDRLRHLSRRGPTSSVLAAALLPAVLMASLLLTSRRISCAQATQYFFSGQYFDHIENPARALAQYEAAEKLCTTHYAAHKWRYNAALCREKLGQTDEAAAELMELIREFPAYPKPYVPLVQLLARENGIAGFRKDGRGGVTLSQEMRSHLLRELGSASDRQDTASARSIGTVLLNYDTPATDIARALGSEMARILSDGTRL